MSELRARAMDVVRRLSRCRRFLGLPVEELLADWRRPQSRSENYLQEIVQLLRRWKQLAKDLEGLPKATVLELQANCSNIGFDQLAENDSPLSDFPSGFLALATCEPQAEDAVALMSESDSQSISTAPADPAAAAAESLHSWLRRFVFHTNWQPLQQLLAECVNQVLERHAQLLELDGFRLPPSKDEMEELERANEVDKLLEAFICPKVLASTQVAARNLFLNELSAEEPRLLPAEVHVQLLQSLIETLGEGEVYTVAFGYFGAGVEGLHLSGDALLTMVACFTEVHVVMAGLCHLFHGYANSSASYINASTHSMKIDVGRALTRITEGVARLESSTVSVEDLLSADAVRQLRFPLPTLRLWVANVQRSLPRLRSNVIDSFRQRMQDLTTQLSSKPCLENCINDRIFLADRVTRHVLGWSGRPAFSAACLSLRKTIDNAKAQRANFKLPDLTEDDPLNKEFAEAEEVFASAKRTVSIIAAAAVVLEKPAATRAAEAEKLLKSSAGVFPQALIQQLEDVQRAVAPPPRKRPRTSQEPDPEAQGALPEF